jgi:hypothetical protein
MSNIFNIASLKGQPWVLVLGLFFLGIGIWFAIKERKKPKEAQDAERRKRSERFIENVNRGYGYGDDEEPVQAKQEIPAPTQNQKSVKRK